MASAKERAWLSAHQKGSRALVQRLDKVHANNPEYQAFKKTHGLENTSSVKQVSKSTVDRVKEKARQTMAGKAYGATKGTRMGSAEGTGETLRDTIAPLTRDQHSAVKAAEREAKAAEKPAAAPKKPAKPKKEKAAAPEKKKPSALELIAAAAAKRKINQPPVSAKALRRIAAVGGMEHDHGGFDDLGDTQYGGRGSYNEEVELDEVAKWRTNPKTHDVDTDGSFRTKTAGDFDNLKARETYLSGAKTYINNRIKNAKNARKQTQSYAKSAIKLYPQKEEVENFKVGDKVKMHTPDDLDWHERNGELISTSDDGHVVKLNDGTKLSATKHQIKKIDEEVELDENDYSRRRRKEEDIISGKKPERKKIPMGSDYAARRRKERLANNGRMDETNYIATADSNPDMLAASRYGTTTTQAPKGTEKDYQKLLKRQIKNRMGLHRKPNLPEEVELSEMDSEGYRGTSEPHHSSYAGKKWVEAKPITPEQAVKGASKIFKDILKKQSKPVKEEAEQIDEMKYGIGTVVKLKKPIDGHEYATVKGFTSSGSTRGLTGRGVPMPAGKVKKVKVALRKNDDHSYYAGPVTHIEHDDVHSVIRESAPGWMLRQNPELAKKVKTRIAIARNRQKQMGNPEPVKEAKKHRMGGALFADTAARLQGAINKHKERMNQIENGPEDTYHHAGLNLTTKSRVKLPAPWAKVEDK